jgi:hypothetical protein
MQAGDTKANRKATEADRKQQGLLRSLHNEAVNSARRSAKRNAAIDRESIKRTAASPAAIALTKATYAEQCARHRAWKRGEDVSSNG